ncbi:hypothetical protein B4114_0638 [Geobacillus stearothermophilus]|uniref:Uncharacterized protein n=1 Tax=Geobacillus stearothermophilus TaxID=1422 RepID=A0A150N5K1_GEOSE|nr:hypothetical protein B4114_0638 [Geobacillus stearothermophilus]
MTIFTYSDHIRCLKCKKIKKEVETWFIFPHVSGLMYLLNR